MSRRDILWVATKEKPVNVPSERFVQSKNLMFEHNAFLKFGTNLRATAAISIPNLVRGFLPLILTLFQFLRSGKVFADYITAAWVTGIIIMTIGFISALFTKESFGKDMDFVER